MRPVCLLTLVVVACHGNPLPTQSPERSRLFQYRFDWPRGATVELTHQVAPHHTKKRLWHLGSASHPRVTMGAITVRNPRVTKTHRDNGSFELANDGRFLRFSPAPGQSLTDQALLRESVYWRELWRFVAADWFGVIYRSHGVVRQQRTMLLPGSLALIPHDTIFKMQADERGKTLTALWALDESNTEGIEMGDLRRIVCKRTLRLDQNQLPIRATQQTQIFFANGREETNTETISLRWTLPDRVVRSSPIRERWQPWKTTPTVTETFYQQGDSMAQATYKWAVARRTPGRGKYRVTRAQYEPDIEGPIGLRTALRNNQPILYVDDEAQITDIANIKKRANALRLARSQQHGRPLPASAGLYKGQRSFRLEALAAWQHVVSDWRFGPRGQHDKTHRFEDVPSEDLPWRIPAIVTYTRVADLRFRTFELRDEAASIFTGDAETKIVKVHQIRRDDPHGRPINSQLIAQAISDRASFELTHMVELTWP